MTFVGHAFEMLNSMRAFNRKSLVLFSFSLGLILSGCSLSASITDSLGLKAETIQAIISSTENLNTNNSTISMTVILSEEVVKLDASNFNVTGGSITVTPVNGSMSVFQVVAVADLVAGQGEVNIQLPPQTLTLIGGSSKPVESKNISFSINQNRPVTSIGTTTHSYTNPTNASPIIVDVSFSGEVTGLTADSFYTENVVLKTLSGSGASYQLTIYPTFDQSNIIVSLDANKVLDIYGNGNIQSNIFSITYDNRVPVPTLSFDPLISSPTNASSVVVMVDFAGVGVSGLSLSDFQVTNGVVSNLNTVGAAQYSDQYSTYTLTLTPTADGVVSILLPANKVTTKVGVNNTVSNTLSFTSDRTGPSISIGAPSATAVNSAGSITFVVTYTGADLISLGSADVTLTASGGMSCSVGISTTGSTSATVTLTSCTGDGSITNIAIAAGSSSDNAGNVSGAASRATSISVDNTAPSVPTVALFSPASSPGVVSTPELIFTNIVSGDIITLYTDNTCSL
ncbi:MAG: Ig-like domain-containing protein [Bacillota bacterium]